MLQHFLRRWKPLITIIFKAADNNTYLRPLSFCPRRMLKRERKWNQSYRLQAKSGYTGRGTSLLPWNFSVSRLAEIFKSPSLRHRPKERLVCLRSRLMRRCLRPFLVLKKGPICAKHWWEDALGLFNAQEEAHLSEGLMRRCLRAFLLGRSLNGSFLV